MSSTPRPELSDEIKVLLVVRSMLRYATREVGVLRDAETDLSRALEDACLAIDEDLRNAGIDDAETAESAFDISSFN